MLSKRKDEELLATHAVEVRNTEENFEVSIFSLIYTIQSDKDG